MSQTPPVPEPSEVRPPEPSPTATVTWGHPQDPGRGNAAQPVTTDPVAPPAGGPGTPLPTPVAPVAVDPDMPAWRRETNDALRGFAVDLAPLHEQPWLWEPARRVNFRTQRAPVTDRTHRAALEADATSSRPGAGQDAFATMARDLVRAQAMWEERPIVWRRLPNGLQLVGYGMYRFTWTLDQTAGHLERWDVFNGWTPAPAGGPGMVSLLENGASREHLVEPIARHAQRHQDRGILWRHPDHTGLRWTPSVNLVPPQGSSTVTASPSTLRRGLREVGRELARLHPFWAVIVKGVWRYAVPYNHQRAALGPALGQLLTCLGQWDAWQAAAAEHPRAHLLLVEAMWHGISPGPHTWHPDLWATRYPAVRPVAWRRLRTGPVSQVNAVCRGWFKHYERLDVLDVCRTGPVPPAALRLIPDDLWKQAHQALVDSVGIKDAVRTWPLRRVKIYLDAVKRRPWTNERLTLDRWLLRAQPVLDWLLAQDTVPAALHDPSAGWDVLTRAWFAAVKDLPSWGRPMRPWILNGTTVTVVATDAEWSWLGQTMGNCLKDTRSDHLRTWASQREGLLLRLGGAQQSAAFLHWQPSADPAATPTLPGHEQGHWTINQHHASTNRLPSAQHEQRLNELVLLLNATVTPTGFVPLEQQGPALDGLRRTGLDPQGLLDALDSAWATQPLVTARPSWRRPIARMMHWAQDDSWWTWDGLRARARQTMGSMDTWMTLLLAALLVALLVTGFAVSWEPAGKVLLLTLGLVTSWGTVLGIKTMVQHALAQRPTPEDDG